MKPWNPNPSGFDSLANFAGEIPAKHLLVLLTRNRDSDLLAQSNWDTVLEFLGGESDSVQIIRHGHWACGWIEYLMIDSRDAEMVSLAESVEEKLSNYPIFDEEDYSTREWTTAMEYWDGLNTKWRVDLCQRSRCSVFAARRNHDLPDRLVDRLMQIASE